MDLSPKLNQPVIRWTGSKRKQSLAIASLIPSHGRYIEPFIGGGAVLYRVSPSTGIAGDICEPLINLWLWIKHQPDVLSVTYRTRWEALQTDKPAYYYDVRESFNRTGSPCDLLLTRTSVNGLIWFNLNGEMNNSFHLTRPGIHPDRLHPVIMEWSSRIQGVEFIHQGFEQTMEVCREGDFIYLDPPYANTKGQYYGRIDQDALFSSIRAAVGRGAKVALSYDGHSGDDDYPADVPEDLFKVSFDLPSGHSPFRATQTKRSVSVVETLHLSYIPDDHV